MVGFITNRVEVDTERVKALHAKGWANMTESEQAEWQADPFNSEAAGYSGAVNLIPYAPYYSDAVELIHRNTHTLARVTQAGAYLYAVVILGAADKFAGKTLTLSCDSMVASGTAAANAAVYWHDGNGFEWGGGSLTTGGSVTFDVTENTGNREYLALYLYGATENQASIGDVVRYNGLMLEFGSVRHSYVPYTPILPTAATRGAYNYADLNRVEMAAAEMGENLGLALETKTDWSIWDVPTEADMTRYLGNIAAIKKACPEKASLPALPARMTGLTYSGANVIEQVLAAAEKSVMGMVRVGEIYCGEV